jgi:hypothetical protein
MGADDTAGRVRDHLHPGARARKIPDPFCCSEQWRLSQLRRWRELEVAGDHSQRHSTPDADGRLGITRHPLYGDTSTRRLSYHRRRAFLERRKQWPGQPTRSTIARQPRGSPCPFCPGRARGLSFCRCGTKLAIRGSGPGRPRDHHYSCSPLPGGRRVCRHGRRTSAA